MKFNRYYANMYILYIYLCQIVVELFYVQVFIENVIANFCPIKHISCTYVHQPQFSFLSKIYPKNQKCISANILYVIPTFLIIVKLGISVLNKYKCNIDYKCIEKLQKTWFIIHMSMKCVIFCHYLLFIFDMTKYCTILLLLCRFYSSRIDHPTFSKMFFTRSHKCETQLYMRFIEIPLYIVFSGFKYT